VESTNQPYPFTEVQSVEPRVEAEPIQQELPGEQASAKSRARLHLLLLALTALTTTLTGAGMSAPIVVSPEPGLVEEIFAPIIAVYLNASAGNFLPIANGLLFTFTLLVILGAHELGHYFACRYYNIQATLPFFIPAPPVITPFGTFGAVIKIREPIRSRRALFDIGIAGPLAGFAFALPAAIIGLTFARAAATQEPPEGGILFNDPLLFIAIQKALALPKMIEWNPIYWAAWGTMLVTALNLFPVGQLDGGHVIYAVFGRRVHRVLSVIVCAATVSLALLAIWQGQPPVYVLWSLVLLFLLRVGHPPIVEDEPLGRARTLVAIAAAIIFLLCFMPFPISSF
jgi:membrane-associated protease RseP (regulator of RpoE activity)